MHENIQYDFVYIYVYLLLFIWSFQGISSVLMMQQFYHIGFYLRIIFSRRNSTGTEIHVL